jgi:hypothetical protein
MPTTPVHDLLGAVRRHLWRGQFVAALRHALWGSAGLMLLAVAVHLAARRVPIGAVSIAIAALWLSMLARAGARRPTLAACALWADRHLGGASAFTTLLETGVGTMAAQNPQAVRWLQSWATARVPDGLRRLAQWHEAARLSRPVLSMIVCAALMALVLSLPDLAPAQRQPTAAAVPSGPSDRATAQVTPTAAQGVDKLAAALRSAPLPPAPETNQARRETGQTQAAAPGKADGAIAATQTAAIAADAPATRTNPSSGTAADTSTAAAAPRVAGDSAGSGSGNEAGDSRDTRGDTAISAAPQGTIGMPGSRPTARPVSALRQADMSRLGTYDPEPSMPGAVALRALATVAAATPPAASDSTRLTPAETSYVQTWMKAQANRR